MCKIIECDVDGVLLDIYTPVEEYLNSPKVNYKFSFENEVKTWGMTELGAKRYFVLEHLTNSVLRGRAKFYDGAVEFIRGICDKAKEKGYEVVLNTVESNSACAYEKNKLLVDFRAKVGRSFTINVQSYKRNKEMLCSDIVIEDSIPNIERSNARVKILKNMFHNRTNYNIIKTDYIRCNDYTDIYNTVVNSIE